MNGHQNCLQNQVTGGLFIKISHDRPVEVAWLALGSGVRIPNSVNFIIVVFSLVRETARCFYNYTAQNEDELSLKEGDIIYIISKECEDDGWWKGELRGKIGVFPDNFCQIITPNEPNPPSGPFTLKITAQERSIGNVSKR
jgi:hypothetical protein